MAINNTDTLYNAAALDAAMQPASDNNFLTDAVTNPIGAVEAVAANVGSSFYNLAALTPLVDKAITEDELVKFLADKGFQDAATYTKQHPQATEMLGLVAGGILPGRLGAAAVMKLLGRGEILATDGAQTISRAMKLKQDLFKTAQEADVASQPYRDALKAFSKTTTADAAISGAADFAAFELAMSQSFALKDSTYEDDALGILLGGAAGVALGALPRILIANKEASREVARAGASFLGDNLVVIPHQLRGTMGEAVMLQAQDKAFKEAISSAPEAVQQFIVDQVNKVGRISKARQIELVNKNTPKDLKVTQGDKGNADSYPFKVRQGVLNGISGKSPTLAGSRSISRFNQDSHTFFDTPYTDLALSHGLTGAQMEDLQAAILSTQQRGWDYTRNASVKALSKSLGLPEVIVDKTHQLMNTVMLDSRTGLVHTLEEGQTIASAKDLGITKVSPAGVSPDMLLAGQVQFNNFDAIRRGQVVVKGSLTVSAEDISKASYADLLYYNTAGLYNKLAKSSPLDSEQLTKAIHDRLLLEVSNMRAAGKGSMEISMRLHLDPVNVEDLIHTGIKDDTAAKLLAQTDSAAMKILDQPALAAVLGDGVLGHSALETATRLDNDLARQFNSEVLAREAQSSQSKLVNAQYNLVNSGLGEGMRISMANLNPALYNGQLKVSADFALRHQGETVNSILDYGASENKLLHDGVIEVTSDNYKLLKPIQEDDFLRTEWGRSASALQGAQVIGDETRTVVGKELGILSPSTGNFTPLADAAGKELGELPQEILDYWTHHQANISSETRHIISFQRNFTGSGEIIDRGIHLAPIALHHKEVAYAIDPLTNDVTLYYANSKKALEALVVQAKNKFPNRDVITERTDLERFNLIHDHVATGDMRAADYNKGKTSATYDGVSTDGSQIEDFTMATTQHLLRLGRKTARLMNPEVTNTLHIMNEAKGEFTSLYRDLEKTAFGGSILNEYKGLSKGNDVYTMGLNTAVEFLDGHFGDGVRWVKNKAGDIVKGKGNNRTPQQNYERVLQAYVERGYTKDQLPWQDQIQALAETEAYKAYGESASKVVSTNSFLASALALRFADLSHALVTAISIPITTLPNIYLEGAGNFAAMKFMMEGVRRAFHPAFKDSMQVLEKRGITHPEVSEANNFIANQLTQPTITSKIESNAVFHMLQTPSAWAEKVSRRVAAGTASAIYDAKHGAGSHLDVAGISFISAFTKRSMGNYTAAQRPAIFQGNLGASLGLFQTYMWTMGQMLFRGLEEGNRMSTASLLASQSAVFGLRSLPGYDLVNHYIGEHYGDNGSTDVTTAIYEGVGSKTTAETMLYGAPSTLLNTSLWTRGIVNPRSPFGLKADGTASFTPAAAGPIVNAIGAIGDTITRVSNGAPLSESIMSALQLQSISRPIARVSDMVVGHSIDRRNGTVDPDAAFKWDLSTFARVVASRPLQEQIVRDTGYQQSYYNRALSFRKQKLMKALRVNVQNGHDIGTAFRDYMDLGGSVSGFRSALNKIYLEDSQGKMATLDNSKLKMAISQYGQ